MLGTHYFNSSHFSREATCSPRTARRFLRSWIESLPKEEREKLHIYPGGHIRLTGEKLRLAVAAYEQFKARRDWSTRNLAWRQQRQAEKMGRYGLPT